MPFPPWFSNTSQNMGDSFHRIKCYAKCMLVPLIIKWKFVHRIGKKWKLIGPEKQSIMLRQRVLGWIRAKGSSVMGSVTILDFFFAWGRHGCFPLWHHQLQLWSQFCFNSRQLTSLTPLGTAGPNAKHFLQGGAPHRASYSPGWVAVWGSQKQHHHQLLLGTADFRPSRPMRGQEEGTVQQQCSACCTLYMTPCHGRFHAGVSATKQGASCGCFAHCPSAGPSKHGAQCDQIGHIAISSAHAQERVRPCHALQP